MSTQDWVNPNDAAASASTRSAGERLKFLIGGLMILGAVGYLVISGTVTGARFFITVDEVVGNAEYQGQSVRVTGAVIGDSINYDSENLIIEFTVVNLPERYDDLALALHTAVNDPENTRMHVRIENEVMPDLLQHEAQAIMTGALGPDGIFHATELNLKCPTRFIEDGPAVPAEHPEI
ncbi:MAG: cytochrome c maturation protein CcmE [Chloroflexi bacterium]|nr:cytochrome c maturation protein CcmE [Chloroflexota bacterium]